MSNENDERGGAKGLADKIQDKVGGMVGMASASTAGSHKGEAFVANACMGDLYEIEAGRLAMSRSRSEPVRQFAAMLVEHHTTAMHQMRSALRSREVTGQFERLAPTHELDNRRRGMLEHLRDAPDDDFDKMFLDQQRLAHQESVALHKGYAENGDNPQLRSVALGGLPMVERHLEAVRRIGTH